MRLGQRSPAWDAGLEPPADNAAVDDSSPHLLDHRLAMQLTQASFLSNNLFFQMIRESPIHLVRNKSLPASYLNPALIGSLLAHSISHEKNYHHRHHSHRSIRAALKRDFGILSNRIHKDQWTGISLARWMDLIVMDEAVDANISSTQNLHTTLVPALWLMALWSLSTSSNCLLDYYMALEQTGDVHLDSKRLDDDCCSFSNHGTPVTSPPVFVEADFYTTKIQDAMDRLIHFYSQPCTRNDYRYNRRNTSAAGNRDGDSNLAARSLELVCASIALRQQSAGSDAAFPVLPNGYYAYDGGEIRADCVEVAVREIVYLLLWDGRPPGPGFLDVSRLPSTACSRMIELLKLESEYIKTETNHENIDFGQAWFDVLSNRKECMYLSKSPSGKPYELAPTIEGIATALWLLLTAGKQSQLQQTTRPWRSLQELADFWSIHRPQNPLFVREDTLRHLQSNDEVVEHETVTFGCRSSHRAIEIRLRCDCKEACGMAAVTRLAEQHVQHQLDLEQAQQLHELLSAAPAKEDIRASHDPSLAMLCLALPTKKEGLRHLQPASSSIFSMLATPLGPDRRAIPLANIDNTPSQSDRDLRELTMSRQVLKEQILQACRLCEKFPVFGAQMLCWILHESPSVVERSEYIQVGDETMYTEIKEAILALPTNILEKVTLLEAIEWNWACRHTSVARKIKQKIRKATLIESFFGFKGTWYGESV
jgi:hypothetical protein